MEGLLPPVDVIVSGNRNSAGRAQVGGEGEAGVAIGN